jgi:hypothetical protein
MVRAPSWVAALFLTGACANGSGEEAAGVGLEEDADGAAGALEDDAGRIAFRSRAVGDGLLEVELEIDPGGIVLSFLVDRARGVVEVDGYVGDTGEDAELGPDERQLLRQLAREIDLLGPDIGPELAAVRDLASHWSEFPTGKDMQFDVVLPVAESSASACAYLYHYVRGTHDGWWESNWSDRTTLDGAYLSMHGPCRGVASEDTQTTWWKTDGWYCPSSEPSHSTSIEYAYGDCLGRCGSGCGSGTVFSWGCLDHDVCNRFGHSWAASLPGGYCADEFTVAASQLLSEPECL